MAAGTNITETGIPPTGHSSRLIRWSLVAGCGIVVAGVLGYVLYVGFMVDKPKPVAMIEPNGYGATTSPLHDQVKPKPKAEEVAPPKPQEPPQDKWWPALEGELMTMFKDGWAQYHREKQTRFDQAMQEQAVQFSRRLKMVEQRQTEYTQGLRSGGNVNIYNTNQGKPGQQVALGGRLARGANGNGGTSLQEEALRETIRVSKAKREHDLQAMQSSTSAQASPISGSQLLQPGSDYVLFAGTHIPVTLDQYMSSDVDGGSWIGHVNTDVFNAINPSELLLPAYTTIFGLNDAKADTNQQALLTPRATLMQLPPSTSYPRGAFLPINVGAQDDLGTAGVTGDVNYHRWQRYGSAALLALINTGAQLGGYMGHSGGYYYSPAQAAAQSFGSTTNEVIGQELRRVLNIRPTITVPLGQTYLITLNQVQEFPGPFIP